jgi:orotate phosphoribosyltransferase
MNLFQAGSFTLRSGRQSSYKLECDALSPDDWAGVAAMILEERIAPPFRACYGVPRGGIPLACALMPFATGNPEHPALLCEDVLTTGGSMERHLAHLRDEAGVPGPFIGVVLFARGACPEWVTPVFGRTSRSPQPRG